MGEYCLLTSQGNVITYIANHVMQFKHFRISKFIFHFFAIK